MSKAFRRAIPVQRPPNAERYEQRVPPNLRTRRGADWAYRMLKRLEGSGQNLADATPKIPQPGE